MLDFKIGLELLFQQTGVGIYNNNTLVEKFDFQAFLITQRGSFIFIKSGTELQIKYNKVWSGTLYFRISSKMDQMFNLLKFG